MNLIMQILILCIKALIILIILKIKYEKILILGNMNELGEYSLKMHLDLLKQIEKSIFKFVILCGEFFERSIKIK